jgi:hypothetical protein
LPVFPHGGAVLCASLGFQEMGAIEVPLRPGIVFPAVRMLRGLGG